MEEVMTKERLESYRSNKMEILELDYVLENRWRSDTMIGNDVIFDYSKGYPMPQSVTGFDYEKYSRLQDRDLRRKKKLEAECKEIEDFVSGITDSVTRRILEPLAEIRRLNPVPERTAWCKLGCLFVVYYRNMEYYGSRF